MPINPDQLNKQIDEQRAGLSQSFDKLRQNVAAALDLYIAADYSELQALAEGNATDRALAYPETPLSEIVDIGPAPTRYTVVGTDASNIPPDRHGGSGLYYVINIGQVVLSYGPDNQAVIDSATFFKAGDVTSAEGQEASTALLLGAESGVRELQQGLALAQEYQADLLFRDGPLTLWDSKNLRDQKGQKLRDDYYKGLKELDEAGIATVGYISNTHSDAVINSLKVLAKQQPNQSSLGGVQDGMVFEKLLQPNQRGPIFRTVLGRPSELAQHIGEICFTYLRTPNEMVRVEFTKRLASPQNQAALDEALAIVLRQIELGQGYPVVLMEAHESAVLRQSDRTLLRLLLEENGLLMPESEKGRSKRLRGL